MLLKQEILSIAHATNLLPTTVEKDYVLSWVLYGISKHAKLSQWLFKGGTCLKKCFFETYRFSEDLDFTVLENSTLYNVDEIKNALMEVAEIVYPESGINLITQDVEVKENINKGGKLTFIAKMSYAGPLGLPSRTQQRIKFDITKDEIITDKPDYREVFHPYSDKPIVPIKIRCYSINEILAEKTRAIVERQGRARDVYDIVNIGRNFREHINKDKAKHALIKKFQFKLLPEPSVDSIISAVDFEQLRANWEDQLGHQLHVLPPVESIFEELRVALSWWLNNKHIEDNLKSISNLHEDETFQRINFPDIATTKLADKYLDSVLTNKLERIRYAARNRLYLNIDYDKFNRLIEPYSLRRSKNGNTLLYAYELKKGDDHTDKIKAYTLSKIISVTVTHYAFKPRHIVEL